MWGHVHEWVCVREVGGWGVWGSSTEVLILLTHPPPYSYVENQQHLKRLEFGDLQGLGELRSL